MDFNSETQKISKKELVSLPNKSSYFFMDFNSETQKISKKELVSLPDLKSSISIY